MGVFNIHYKTNAAAGTVFGNPVFFRKVPIMSFETTNPVRFAQVDLAGTVFYPRYFEMLNAAVEDWFAYLGKDFRSLHFDMHIGTPLVKLDAEFVAASSLGDLLSIRLELRRLGVSSCDIKYSIWCEAELRMRGSMLLVCVDTRARKSTPWPDDLREKMTHGMNTI